MVYPTDEETFDVRNTPEFIREGHLNGIQALLKRIQDFIGYGGRLHDEGGLVMPVGSILAYGGTGTPTGWALCDGKENRRDNASYIDLFAVIGTNYGARNNDYFNVPDLRGYFKRGYSKIIQGTFDPADVNVGVDTINFDIQAFYRTGIPVRFTTDDTLPVPLVINTTYFLIHFGGDLFKVASTRANAITETQIDLTTVGVGNSYCSVYVEEDKASRLKLTKGGNDGDNLGSYQGDIFQGHHHMVKDSGTGNYYDNDGPDGVGSQTLKIESVKANASGKAMDLIDDGTNETPRDGIETRPRNVNVNYIIKL